MPSGPPRQRARLTLRPQATLVAAALLSTIVLAWSGLRATRAEAARRVELLRARAALDEFAALRRRYTPAVAAESIAWRRAWLELRDLGVLGDERLSLTQQVARTAESSGLRDVKVLIGEPDTTGQQARLSTEGVQSQSAPYSLLVECKGGLDAVIAFLGQLPPSVAPTTLSLVRQDGRGPHRIALAVYELTFSNGVPPGWPSVERGNAGVGNLGRPGG